MRVSSWIEARAQPMTRRENRASTTARDSHPSYVHSAVISPVHFSVGRRLYNPDPRDSVRLVPQAHFSSWPSDAAFGERIIPALASDVPPASVSSSSPDPAIGHACEDSRPLADTTGRLLESERRAPHLLGDAHSGVASSKHTSRSTTPQACHTGRSPDRPGEPLQ